MIRTVRFVSYQNNFLCQSFARRLSAQAAISYKPKDDEYANAIPFNEIPGLSKFELIRRFLPGGKFHKMSFIDILQLSRDEFGDFHKWPGVFGQNSMVMTYNADDIEFIHRNEGTYPYRRGLETMKYFRENIRSDVYEVGGLINE